MSDANTCFSAQVSVRVVDRESTRVTLSWRRDARGSGASSLIGYTIEYYCSDLQVCSVLCLYCVSTLLY